MKDLAFRGAPIAIEFLPRLRVSRGKLVPHAARGTEVHAGSFLQQRRIVLDASLRRDPKERDRILLHEIFHFVWWKLHYAVRRAYENLVRCELERQVPGEMGWSAECRKTRLRKRDWEGNRRTWREYLCESFCDTAAAHLLALRKHDEITLPAPARRARFRWMEAMLRECRLSI